MKLQQKKRMRQKLWGWISFAINCLIITIFLSKKVADFLRIGIFLTVSIICYGVAKMQADKSKDDLSGTSVAIEYVCVCILTFLAACRGSEYLASTSLMIVLAFFAVTEFLVFLLITYWYPIRRFFIQKRNKHT